MGLTAVPDLVATMDPLNVCPERNKIESPGTMMDHGTVSFGAVVSRPELPLFPQGAI